MDEFLVEYYVIHLKKASERLTNIKNMEFRLKKEINIFNAIDGKCFNSKDLHNIILTYDEKLKIDYTPNYTAEIGCYLSHYLLYKSLVNSQYNFTVIFEDDFIIIDDNLHDKIIDLIKKLNNN